MNRPATSIAKTRCSSWNSSSICIAKQNFTLVLVTHDMGIARQAGRVIAMKDGRIVSDSLNAAAPPN